MIVAIHQPNLFPWPGFFNKMIHADLFILLDNVQFSGRTYQNRTRINTIGGAKWLSVPIDKKGMVDPTTAAVRVAKDQDWRRDHLRKLEAAYAKSPHFSELYPELQSLYEDQYDHLVDFTIPGIEWMKRRLGVGTPLTRASQYGVEGVSSELLASLVREAGGTIYLSGPTGKDYMDEHVFHSQGIEVRYITYSEMSYPQMYSKESFQGGLSAIDYLFCTGSPIGRRQEIDA